MDEDDWEEWTKQRLTKLEAAAPKKRKKAEPFVVAHLALTAAAYRALNCPKAMVWLWLLHQARKTGNPTVTIPNGALAKLGVSRAAKLRALRQLEAAGLVVVEQRPRKTPIVTLA